MKLGLYQHYSGKHYYVLGIARHSETCEEMAVYQSLYGDYAYWVRPLQMFLENVVVDGTERPRFQFIREMHTQPARLDEGR